MHIIKCGNHQEFGVVIGTAAIDVRFIDLEFGFADGEHGLYHQFRLIQACDAGRTVKDGGRVIVGACDPGESRAEVCVCKLCCGTAEQHDSKQRARCTAGVPQYV